MTPEQHALHEFLLDRQEHGLVPPTVREMMRAIGASSTGTPVRLLDALERQGLVVRRAGQTRGVRAIPINPFDGVESARLIQELKRRGDL